MIRHGFGHCRYDRLVSAIKVKGKAPAVVSVNEGGDSDKVAAAGEEENEQKESQADRKANVASCDQLNVSTNNLMELRKMACHPMLVLYANACMYHASHRLLQINNHLPHAHHSALICLPCSIVCCLPKTSSRAWLTPCSALPSTPTTVVDVNPPRTITIQTAPMLP